MISIKKLGKKIAAVQDEIINKNDSEAGSIIEARKMLFENEKKHSSKYFTKFRFAATAKNLSIAASVILIIGILYFAGFGHTKTKPANDNDKEWITAPENKEILVDFPDKSTITLSPESDLRIFKKHKNGSHVLLERGTARLEIVHSANTTWLMDAGPYKIKITGTQFNVSWDPSQKFFELTLKNGSVELTGPMVQNGRKITKSENFKAWVKENKVKIAKINTIKEAPSVTYMEIVSNSPKPLKSEKTNAIKENIPLKNSDNSKSADTKKLSWFEMNRKGLFKDVVKEAMEMTIEKALQKSSAGDLLALGNAARLLGKWNLADSSYMAVRKRFAGTKFSATAAFAIGKMAFDHQQLYKKAANWLGIYLKEQRKGLLIKSALGLIIEAHHKAGDLKGAKIAAMQYIKKYPDGPHVDVAKKVVQE